MEYVIMTTIQKEIPTYEIDGSIPEVVGSSFDGDIVRYYLRDRSTDVVGMALPVQNINHSTFRSMFEKEKLFAGAEPNIVAQWTALYDAHTKIACLMLESMTPELHRQFELHYPYDMVQELRSMFEKQAGVEKFDLIQSFHAFQTRGGQGKDKKFIILSLTTKSLLLRVPRAKDDACLPQGKEVGHWKRNRPVYLAELQKKRKKVGFASSSANYKLEFVVSVGSRFWLTKDFVNDFTDIGISAFKECPLKPSHKPRNQWRAVDLDEIQEEEDTTTSEITSNIPQEAEGFEPPQEEVIPIRRCTRPDVAFRAKYESRFQTESSTELRVECYCDAGLETDRDDTKSQTGYVFVLNGGAVD
ncbi:hypothetical protein Tco_1468264 [Tanacetum coccineum]